MNALTFINLNQNELRNAVIGNLGTAPTSPKAGQQYYDTVTSDLLTWNGTAWIHGNAALLTATIPNTALAPSALNRANQNGTQLASTISNFAAAANALTLDTFAPPVNPVSMNSQRITNVAAPTTGTDAANQAYVLAQAVSAAQSAAAGIVSKQAVAVVATTNQPTLSSLLTIDGVTLVAGQRVLLTAQTTATQNGVYIAAAGAWTRSANDSNNELDLGATWFVEQGTVYASSTWRLATPTSGAITPGTTVVTFTQLTAAISYTATNGVQVNGNIFSAQVVGSGGVLAGASGLQVDTTVVTRKYSANIGDGSTLAYTVTHNLGTADVVAVVRDASGNAQIADWSTNGSATTIVVTFAVAPTANQYRVTVLG